MDRHPIPFSRGLGNGSELTSHAYPAQPYTGNGIQAPCDAPSGPIPSNGSVPSGIWPTKPHIAPQEEKRIAPIGTRTSNPLLKGQGPTMLELKRRLDQGMPLHLSPISLRDMAPTSLKDTPQDGEKEDRGHKYSEPEDSFTTLVNGESSSFRSSSTLSDAETAISDSSASANSSEGTRLAPTHGVVGVPHPMLAKVCINFNLSCCRKHRCLFLHKLLSKEELLAITSTKLCNMIVNGKCTRGPKCGFYHPRPQIEVIDPSSIKTQSKTTDEVICDRTSMEPTVCIVKPRESTRRNLKILRRLQESEHVYRERLSKIPIHTKREDAFAPTKDVLLPEDSNSSASAVKLPPKSIAVQNMEHHQSGGTWQKSDNVPSQPCHFCRLGICSNGKHFSAQLAAIPQASQSNRPNNGRRPISSHSDHKRGSTGVPVSPSAEPRRNASSSPSSGRSQALASSAIVEPEELDVTLLKSTRVKVGRGLQILDITTSFESKEVLLSNLPLKISETAVRQLLSPYGKVERIETWSSGMPPHASARIIFASESAASAAIDALNGSKQSFGTIRASHMHHNQLREIGRLSAGAIKINLPAPGLVGYLGFKTLEEAEAVVKKVHGSTVKSHVLSARVSYGMPNAGAHTVTFEGIPPYKAEETIKSFRQGEVPRGEWLIGRCTYDSVKAARTGIERILDEIGSLLNFHILPDPPVNGRIHAVAHFASPEAAAAATRALHGRKFAFIGREKLYVQHLHKLEYKISNTLRIVLLPELTRLADYARSLPGALLVWNASRSEMTDVVLHATHLTSLKAVKAPLDRLLAGEVLEDQGKVVWDNFFACAAGHETLRAFSRSVSSYTWSNRMRCVIKVWGTHDAINKTKELVLDFIRKRNGEKCFFLPLYGKTLMQLLFDNLDDVKATLGDGNAFVDFSNRKFVVRGTKEQFDWVVGYLSEKYGYLEIPPSSCEHAVNCPICTDSVIDPIKLGCGHVSCRACLKRYISSAHEHKMFPLRCLGDEGKCTELLSLSMCKRLVPVNIFAKIVEAAFLVYIQTRPEEFHYCPTPDCPQIYRTSTSTATLQCPTCLVRICSSCHSVEHDGVPCAVSVAANEKLFEEWREQNNVKKCPKCTMMIEKIAGCNHLMCARCNIHICWECMDSFNESRDVYDHMNKKHGGIGL